MAPQRNNDRHSGHTGTIPKTKVRNNCNVPQEAVTPTRRDMTSNLVSTSLDWVPVSEYNSRSNYNQSRKPANNTSDHELTDLDNSVSFESGFGRFVPVRPQPRALPLNVQNRENLTADHNDDGAGSTASGYSQHAYAHSMQNGLNPHSNHAAAAVMIVNPTTPNAVTGNMTQPFNAPGNQNRNNLTRNLNPARNNFDGNSNTSNNTTPPISNSRTGTKTVNLINNMYDSGQGSSHNVNENQAHRESARALGEAIVAACPDAAAVERRLGQIREYIRVTSSLVDTMRNSEDEAFIEHTKEEYDELVQMVMTLKESESKLEKILVDNQPDNVEVPAEELAETVAPVTDQSTIEPIVVVASPEPNVNPDVISNIHTKVGNSDSAQTLKKVTNIENEHLNKTLSHKSGDDTQHQETHKNINHGSSCSMRNSPVEHMDMIKENGEEVGNPEVEIKEIESFPLSDTESKTDDSINDVLRQNILSCVEKVALIEELKHKKKPSSDDESQDVVVRPMSVQSNGSTYSENELWQNEIKNKMEISQQRLAALKQQQKRLLKYQAEAKQQLEEMHRVRQSQEIHPSTSHDNLASMQNQMLNGHHQHQARMYAANQIGVATTLPHSTDGGQVQQNLAGGTLSNIDNESQSHEDRFSHRDANIASSEEAGGGQSDVENYEDGLSDRGRQLTMKLRELQLKKQHVETLVSEFQKIQLATRLESSHNTYSSSGEESMDEEPTRKCNKSGSNIKNEDPFKLMEIKAIKTALQKTKDLMRSVENYEAEHLSEVHEEPFQMQQHSNIHDNKSEGGSTGGWSHDGSMCRVRNTLPPRHKFTNEQHDQQLAQQQSQQLLQQHSQQQQQQIAGHEANIASLQELAQELRMETEKIMGERARLKDMVSNKEFTRKHKKVNEEVRPSTSGVIGPAERRQIELRALLTEKQKELEALLKKEKVIVVGSEDPTIKQDSRAASVVNQSYNSELEEPDSRSEQILLHAQNENYRGGGDSGLGGRSTINTLPSHLGSTYASDSDSASRTKSNQRNRGRRRQTQERQPEEANPSPTSHTSQSLRHEPRVDPVNVNTVPPMSQNGENPANMPYPHLPPPWSNNKSNQDMRANQFTQNSHSQTMERLLSTPQMSYPPQMPFNMLMPYGVVGGCGCGCGLWGAWCWQQLGMQQREIHQLREQLNHLEERWRVETASHTLNNQVPPGNRANNYWDNFRSYSRQNLLSASSKTNADGHLGVVPQHNPHPLVERSHNTLHPSTSATPPANTPKRNVNATQTHNTEECSSRYGRSNVTYERSLSFSSAPDVLNVNQNNDEATATTSTQARHFDDVNINRQDASANSFRNLNITNPIPEIIQSHANNINTTPSPLSSKKKSSSKLPAKNSANRRNYTLEYAQTSNINIASSSEAPNSNLASANRDIQDKTASKLFDFLRENVYSEVSALIGVNESHPDFLIQLFRELQLISSDPLRQRVLQSIRNVLSQYPSIIENEPSEASSPHEDPIPEIVSTTANEHNNYHESSNIHQQNACSSNAQIDNGIVRFLLLKSEDICTPELLDMLANVILNCTRQTQLSKKRLLEMLSKYEGTRVCDVSGDILESLPLSITLNNDGDESTQHTSELSESSVLQDVAGSLNLFSSSETQLHQMNACPYDLWPGHVHMDIEPADLNEASSGQEGKMDLINCSEMLNGDLAEADQTCRSESAEGATGSRGEEAGVGSDALPDVVDTDETTPTEAEAEWLGLDRVPTRLHMDESSENQKD